jgi:hypothetical protein
MGGEPLLHPKIDQFCAIARKHFPAGNINIVTNGILLLKMPEAFWESCRENDIQISITNYPVKLNRAKIMELIRQYRLKFTSWNGKGIKTMWKLPLDASGSQNPEKSFKVCLRANRCAALVDGKLYPCPNPAYCFYLNRSFGCSFAPEEKDYIDIHKTGNIDDVYEFLVKPIPFCRYCRTNEMEYGIKWAVSKKEAREFI